MCNAQDIERQKAFQDWEAFLLRSPTIEKYNFLKKDIK